MSSRKSDRWLLLFLIRLLLAAIPVTAQRSVCAAELAAESRSLASSARPITNEVVERSLQRITEAVRAGESAQARVELRNLFDSAATRGVVLVGSSEFGAARYQSVVDAARRLLASLPDEERRLFVQQSEPAAKLRLQEALTHDADDRELCEIADRFPGTESARQATLLLVSRFLDHEQLWQARAVLLHLQRELASANVADPALADRLQLIETLEAAARNTGPLADKQNSVALTDAGATSHSEPSGWQAAAAFEDSSVGWFQPALDEHRRQAIPVLPRLTPVIADGVVIGRTLNRLFAFDVATGRPRWQADSAATGSQRPSRAALSGTLESLAAVGMARQVQFDTTFSRMSVDVGRLLCLEHVSGFGRSPGGASAFNVEAAAEVQQRNQLVARRVTDGSVVWTRSAFVVSEVEEVGFETAPAYFLGVPSTYGEWLVGLLRHDAALFIYALNRNDGVPQWMLKIGERSGTAAADADWTSIACPVVAADGLLICSTGAGLIAAVDPIFRRVVWARRYSRADEPPAGSPLPGAATHLTRRWWNGWREITLLKASNAEGGTSLIYAGPDAGGVRILEPGTGHEVAHVDADQPLFLEMLTSPREPTPLAAIVSRHALTAFDPGNGTIVWTQPIPEPIGRGFCSVTRSLEALPLKARSLKGNRRENLRGSFYVFPALDGTTRQVRLSDGQITAGQTIDAGTPRTWTLSDAGVVEQTFEDLQLLPAPTFDQNATLQWASGFGSEAGGDDALLTAIRRADSADTLRDLVTMAGLADVQSSLQQNLPQQKPAADSDAGAFDRPGAMHAAAAVQRARELQADRLAFDLLVALSARNPNGAISLREAGPARIVRYGRWLQGQLSELLLLGKPMPGDSSATVELQARFATVIGSARTSRDPFALSRLIERLRDVPGIANAEVHSDGRVGRSFLQNEIALHRLASSTDPMLVRDARRQLVELYLAHSYRRDAASVVEAEERDRSTLALNAPHKPLLSDEQTASLSAAGRQSDWKAAAPRLAERPDRYEEVRYFAVPVESRQGALFERLNVAVRLVGKSGSSLQFYGDGQAGYWKLELPASESALHTWFTLPRGWGVGRLLILRIGTELHGITPYSDTGEPRAQLRWTLDMADGSRLSTHQLARAVPGFGAEDLTPLDSFDRPMAQVGPVQAGYLCYRDRGQLICLDPETGQQLWSRAELPAEVRCVGDEQSIWLIDEQSGEVTHLRATDGAQVNHFRLADVEGAKTGRNSASLRLLTAHGRRLLLGLSDENPSAMTYRRLTQLDLLSQEVEWSIALGDAAVVFAVGNAWFGVLDRDGQLTIRDLQNGQAIVRHVVDRPAELRTAYCSSDSHSHIVALSTETESGFQAVGEPRFGFRTPLISGRLIAIDAHNGGLLWQQSIAGERFPLDQPKSLPLLTLTSRPDQQGQAGYALRIVDRRTGQTLTRRKSTEQFTPFAFDPNAALQRVVVRFSRSALRIDYEGP
ncbi:PQQ-binding-like beta-propeller repeat protein [bacterium]|nr:PQQ-binding-like beta-propeller repeat protein [bacterium]